MRVHVEKVRMTLHRADVLEAYLNHHDAIVHAAVYERTGDVVITYTGRRSAAIAREIADVTIKADSLEELVAFKAIANSLQKRVHANYRFVLTFNSALIALGALGILQPASSAMLHNLSTIGISLKSMTNLLPENKAPQLKP